MPLLSFGSRGGRYRPQADRSGAQDGLQAGRGGARGRDRGRGDARASEHDSSSEEEGQEEEGGQEEEEEGENQVNDGPKTPPVCRAWYSSPVGVCRGCNKKTKLFHSLGDEITSLFVEPATRGLINAVVAFLQRSITYRRSLTTFAEHDCLADLNDPLGDCQIPEGEREVLAEQQRHEGIGQGHLQLALPKRFVEFLYCNICRQMTGSLAERLNNDCYVAGQRNIFDKLLRQYLSPVEIDDNGDVIGRCNFEGVDVPLIGREAQQLLRGQGPPVSAEIFFLL